MRTMYDSTTATDIPTTAQMVAGYINGTYQWSPADWAQFPHATKVRIATRANINDGHVLDVEAGDATPGQAPAWAVMRRAAGVDPTIYCNASAQIAVAAAFNAAGVAQPHYWTAHYDNLAAVPPGAVAKQYINDPRSGGHYDLSAVADYWPGVDPAPAPKPAPPISGDFDEETTMLAPAGTNEHVVLPCAGRPLFWYLYAAFGRDVTVHTVAYVMPTDSPERFAPGGYESGSDTLGWIFESDQPGPVDIPRTADGRQPVGVALRYTADHAFTLFCG